MQERQRILYANGKIRVPYRKAYLMDNHGNVYSHRCINSQAVWEMGLPAFILSPLFGLVTNKPLILFFNFFDDNLPTAGRH